MKAIPKRNLHVSHGALVLRKHRFWVFPKNPSPPQPPDPVSFAARARRYPDRASATLLASMRAPFCPWLLLRALGLPAISCSIRRLCCSSAAVDGRETLQDATPTPSDHKICFRPETKAAPSRLAGRSKDGSGAVAALLPSFKSGIITSKTVCYTIDPM